MLYDPKWQPKEIEIKIEPWQQVLLDAADTIEKHGWIQGDRHTVLGFCILGAIDSVATVKRAAVQARLKFQSSLGGHSIAKWNDRQSNTKSNVLKALRKAAALDRKETVNAV